MPRLAARFALLPLLLAAAPQTLELPPPGSDAWRPLVFRRVERQTRYTAVDVEGRAALRADADCSASARVLPLEGLRLPELPVLRWRWKLERGLSHTDERSRSGDDFAARVYVMFSFDAERASSWERLRRRLAGSWYDAPPSGMPGSAINYVWSAHEPRGSAWDNPYVEASKMVSLGPGPNGVWREERVDLRADYRRLFGREPTRPIGVALMSDADDSCRQASALFAELRFTAR